LHRKETAERVLPFFAREANTKKRGANFALLTGQGKIQGAAVGLLTSARQEGNWFERKQARENFKKLARSQLEGVNGIP